MPKRGLSSFLLSPRRALDFVAYRRGSYSRKGVFLPSKTSKCLLESPSSEPLLKTLTERCRNLLQYQSNRYATWVRCPQCSHTHGTITFSATCCMSCKGRCNRLAAGHRQPAIEAVDVTREYPWTKRGMLMSRL